MSGREMSLDIFMAVPGMAFQGDTLERQSLGGAETAGLYMARELAALGHKVTVFSECEAPGLWDDVRYVPIREWVAQATLNPHDVSIIQRLPVQFGRRLASRLNILWCHD